MIEGQRGEWIIIEGVMHIMHAIARTPFAGNMRIVETIFERILFADHMRIAEIILERIGGIQMKLQVDPEAAMMIVTHSKKNETMAIITESNQGSGMRDTKTSDPETKTKTFIFTRAVLGMSQQMVTSNLGLR